MSRVLAAWLLFATLVVGSPAALAQGSLHEAAPGKASSARECAICHFRWVGTFFNEGRGTPLAPMPQAKQVGTEEMCFSCHDGSVVDSRRELLLGSRHEIGEPPPDDMDIPEAYPLDEDGNVTCSTCHTAHALPGSERSAGDPVFMRRSNLDSAMCEDCHQDQLDTERVNNHPLGANDRAIPRALTSRGARTSADGGLTCQTCHAPHGALYDAMLIDSAADGGLCTACHESEAGPRSHHPVDRRLDSQGRRLISSLGGELNDGALTCLSCHGAHQAPSEDLLLTRRSGPGACGACHESAASRLRGGGHGREPCASCHGMHDLPRGFGDGARAEGVGPQICLDCHADGSEDPQVDLDATHPVGIDLEEDSHGDLPALDGRLACTTCHAAHSRDPKLLLEEARSGEGCATCHEAQGPVIGSDHDAAIVAVGEADQTCLSCHDVHGSAALFLMEEVDTGVNPASGRCLSCHDGSTDATPVGRHDHPEGYLLTVEGLPPVYQGEVPFYGPDGAPTGDVQLGEIACATCHDVHRWSHGSDEVEGAAEGTELDSFLRSPMDVVQACSVCHGAEAWPAFTWFHQDSGFRPGVEGGDTP